MSATDDNPPEPSGSPSTSPLPRWEKKAKNFDAIASLEFSRMIYASNALENTGLNLEDTTHLCGLVFTDEKVPQTYKEEKRMEAQRKKKEEEDKQNRWMVLKLMDSAQEYVTRTYLKGGREDGNDVVEEVIDERRKNKQARREVIQHARAWKYFLERFCIEQEELNINLIQNTHTVLCAGYENEDNSKEEWWEWAGVYRTFNTIGAGTLRHQHQKGTRQRSRDRDGSITPTQKNYKKTNEGRRPLAYIRPSAVEAYMNEMIRNFEILKEVGCGDGVDEYIELAAWVGGMIMNIWPFRVENGKLARLVMNGVLWRYCGIVADIGEGERDKEEYFDIVERAAQVFHEEEFTVTARRQRGHHDLAAMVRRKLEEGRERVEETMEYGWGFWG
ncbi:hypothetical protein TWF718_010128 [Orbilia javanica]|uniref:Fido domain-containing protein n=1 Tax=Orbilia javanica TaxID=47235 RepID=A0AAN8RAU1_9PEZI